MEKKYPAPWWAYHSDEDCWEAASPYQRDEDGDPICWRLKRSSANRWYEDHDEELMTGEPEAWFTLEEAKAAIAVKHAEIARLEGLDREVGACC